MHRTAIHLDAALAMKLISESFDCARARSHAPMAVVVVDAASHVVASAREPGATALRLDIAAGKANAAIGMGANSRTLTLRADKMPGFYSAIATVASAKFIPQTGAVLIRDPEGQLLGAVGASGGTGDEDENICITGVAACGLVHA